MNNLIRMNKLDFFKIYWLLDEILKQNPTLRMSVLIKMLREEIEKAKEVKVEFTPATDDDVRDHVEGEIEEERNRRNE